MVGEKIRNIIRQYNSNWKIAWRTISFLYQTKSCVWSSSLTRKISAKPQLINLNFENWHLFIRFFKINLKNSGIIQGTKCFITKTLFKIAISLLKQQPNLYFRTQPFLREASVVVLSRNSASQFRILIFHKN